MANANDDLRTNRRLLIVTAVLWIVLQWIVFTSVNGFPNVDFVDTDDFTRMTRVEQLISTHQWFDFVNHRSNAPFGETMHWTRPVDVLLLVGTGMLTPFLGLTKALYWSGLALSPILGALSLMCLSWAARPVLPLQSQRPLWLLFYAQPIFYAAFQFGRPDHHSTMVLLFILLIGCLLRMVEDSRSRAICIWGGIISGLAMWISVESLVAVFLVYLVMAVLWFLKGGGYAEKLLFYGLPLFIVSSMAVMVEHPMGAILKLEYDRISVVHVFVFFLAVLAGGILRKCQWDLAWKRWCTGVFIGMVCTGVLWAAVPDFLAGPFSQVNPRIIPIWLDLVREVQPLSRSLSTVILFGGPLVLSIAYLLYALWGQTDRKQGHHIALVMGLLLLMVLVFMQIRWAYYSSVLVLITLALLLHRLLQWTEVIPAKPQQYAVRILILMAVFITFPTAALLATPQEEKERMPIPAQGDVRKLCEWLSQPGTDFSGRQAILLAFMDFGPEILYRTKYSVIATPYHRNDAGILFNYEVMTAHNTDEAYAIMSKRQVDLFILCPGSPEEGLYRVKNQPDTFYQQLVQGRIPPWLEILETTPELKEKFIVLKVVE